MPDLARLVSKQHIADTFKTTPATIQKLIDDGTLKAYRLGPHTWRLDPLEVEESLRTWT